MAPRKQGATKDPNSIRTVDDWAQSARRTIVTVTGRKEVGYMNVVLGPNGELQILTPGTSDVAKTIPHEYGTDMLNLLSSEDPQLRASAQERQASLQATMEERIREAREELHIAEKALLEAVGNWKKVSDPSLKRSYATIVGVRSKEVQEAEANLQSARYPHRRVNDVPLFVEKKMLHYSTMDERKVEVVVLKQSSTTVEERVVSH